MEKYIVTVEDNGTIIWRNEKGKYHRLEGPAIKWANGDKSWYLNDERLSEEEFNKRVNNYESKVVEIDGVKYKLTQV